MPPPGVGKRKRGERQYSGDSFSRPSPHRPENLSLAQSQSPSNAREYNDNRPRPGRRPSRGGRANAQPPTSSIQSTPDRAAAAVNSPAPVRQMAPTDTNMANATTEQPEEPSAEVPTQPYVYTCVDDDACQDWETGGRPHVVRLISEALLNNDDAQAMVIIQELVQSAVRGRLTPSDAGSLVKEIIAKHQDADSGHQADTVAALLTDALSITYDDNPKIPIPPLVEFVAATEIPFDHLRRELDIPFLGRLELVRNTFPRVGIRKQTNVLYRQANFNLMREESEGFAKLVTEVFDVSSTDHPSADNVDESVQRVKALIGAFDLDVGRSLDVVLDVFGSVLVKQCRFFVKFLRASPWWPRQSLGAEHQNASGLPIWAQPESQDWFLTESQKQAISEQNRSRDATFWNNAREDGLRAFYKIGLQEPKDMSMTFSSIDGDFARAWVKETGMRPPDGNRDAAQLLGFKLRFYSSSPARDENDILPDNLIYLSALLIKIGFISLKDLYPHIWRSDEAIAELKKQKEKEKDERDRAARPGAGAKNALLMAGALADDTLPIPSRLREANTRAGTPSRDAEAAKASSKETSAEPADQKVTLLKSLLAIGAIPEALFILGRFPWIIDLYPEMPEFINRILHHCLTTVYEAAQPLATRSSLREQQPLYETDVPGVPKGQVKLVEAPERKVLRWPQLDRSDSTDGTHYRFYWDDWSDNIPMCQTVDDVFTLCETVLPLVGVKIGQDPALVLKIARIGKQSLQIDKSEANQSRWLNLSRRILLPSLSLTKKNVGEVNEVFELISLFSINTRFLMYIDWTSGRVSRNPDVKAAYMFAAAETRSVLKRMSKENLRPTARALARIAYANPHALITTALTQIESYDSISMAFVDGARYFTDLGYDVLTWAIIGSMSRQGRQKIQEGGLFASPWLQALAHFAGRIYKKYGVMRPGPLLQYVSQRLDAGQSTDLIMLEQIVLEMAGVTLNVSYNDKQLQAMGGGSLLQSLVLQQLQDKRNDSSLRSSSKRLIKALQDTGLTAKFLISVAQQRQACIFEDGDVPLKATANTFDEIHRILVQYMGFLRTNLSTDDLSKIVPDVVDLMVEYDICPEVAFWICRDLIAKQIADYEKEDTAKTVDYTEREVNGDIEMAEQADESSEEDGEAQESDDIVQAAATPTEADILGGSIEDTENGLTPVPESDGRWNPVLRNIMERLEGRLPDELISMVGTGFFVTFWQLSLYDISIPGKSYEEEMQRQRALMAKIGADRSEVSLSAVRKRESEKKVITDLIDNLLSENKQHLKAYAEIKSRLQREKDLWFAGKAKVMEQLNGALLEYCFLPRALASPLDALFCFKLVKFMHASGTANFRTLGCYDLLFRSSRLTSLIFMCSSDEADNFGLLLKELLKDLGRWHGTKATYEKEAWGFKKQLQGFALKVDGGKPVAFMDFEQFRRVLYKWHGQLQAALLNCLSSPEYMHVRNAISVLQSISEVYPVLNWHGTMLQKSVDKLKASDKEDLKVSSQALLGTLTRKSRAWIVPQAFCTGHKPTVEQETEAIAKSKDNSRDAAGKDGDHGEIKDAAMIDEPARKAETRIEPPKDSRKETPALPSKPVPTNGAVGRSTPDLRLSDRSSRQPRSETPKPSTLPRKLSPAPRHQPPASLPSRPDPRDPRNGARESARVPPRPAADSRAPPGGRDTPSGHRGPEPSHDDYDRRPRRHERDGPLPPRDDRGYGREREAERPYAGEKPRMPERDRPSERAPDRDRQALPPARERDTRDRPARSTPGGPHASDEPHSRPSSSAPVRPPSSHSDSVGINPERAALINGPDTPQGPNMSIRGQAQERSSRPSRTSSPRREDERRGPPRQDRDERHPSDRRPEMLPSRSGPQPSAAPPLLPSTVQSRYASAREGRQSQGPQVDMQHGRLEQDSSHRPPTRTERPAEAEPPSGPRARGSMPAPRGRGAPPINTQVSQPASDRPTPTGPAARHSRNNSYHDHSSAPPSATDTTGVHPSRLQHIAPSPTESSRPPLPVPAPQNPPPAGPRSNAPSFAPSGPSPPTRAPPSGPHQTDSSVRGGRSNRHPLAAVNNTLTQAGQGQGPTGRGRGSARQSSGNFSSHAPPSGPGSQNQASRSALPPQDDLFASSNPNGTPSGPRPPSSRHETSSRDRRHEPEERGEGGDRRSSRRHEEPRESHRSEREGRDNRDEREPSRRDERPSDRDRDRPSRRGGGGDDQQPQQQQQPPEERRGGYGRNAPREGGPRDDMPPRKHPRNEDGPPYPSGGGGGGGRGGSRATSESKRVRRGP